MLLLYLSGLIEDCNFVIEEPITSIMSESVKIKGEIFIFFGL